MTCIKMLTKLLPEIKTFSLYAVLAEIGLPDRRLQTNTTATTEILPLTTAAALPFTEALVFDPCSALPDSQVTEDARLAVRTLLTASGITPAPDDSNPCRKACCGFGGHIYPANPDVYAQVTEDRVAASPLPYVTYCSNCNDIFRKQGKESVHILDLLFTDAAARQGAAPTVTGIRRGRERLKVLLLREFWDEEAGDSRLHGNDRGVSILPIEDELRQKMDRALILEDDLLAVIAYAKAGDCELLDEETGVFTAHRRIGAVTYWAQYRDEGDAIRLINAYSHRLVITGEDGENGKARDTGNASKDGLASHAGDADDAGTASGGGL
jgi:hypothetical protein